MGEDNEENLLDNLLLAAIETEEADNSKNANQSILKTLNEDEYFLSKIATNDLKVLPQPSTSSSQNKQNKTVPKEKLENQSLIHSGDTDSSDDEDKRDFENRKYNDCGKQIKNLLSSAQSNNTNNDFSTIKTWKTKRPVLSGKTTVIKPAKEECTENILTDPFFGIRISKPLISSATLCDRMSGRAAISMAKVKYYISLKATEDWVIAGAIVDKSPVKTSQNGNNYVIFTLSDLKTDLKSVSLFLFRNAYKELWKTAIGTVIGVLNPSILENRDGSKQEATLSVDNHQKVMIFGQSKDFGYCKSPRKDGKQCTSFVNTSICEFCIYHVRQAYQQCSKRSELQAKFAGGGLTALRNKVLGKNEVFYAGKSYMAIPAKANKKLVDRDTKILQALTKSGTVTLPPVKKSTPIPRKGSAASLDVPRAQRLKDLELLKKLKGTSDITSVLEEKANSDSTSTLSGATICKPKSKTATNTSPEGKAEFDPKSVSSGITLDKSKKAALDVISKLKNAKKTNIDKSANNLEGKNNVHPKLTSSGVTLDISKESTLDISELNENPKKTPNDIPEKNITESKINFDPKSISSGISLHESKMAALDVISKLKNKTLQYDSSEICPKKDKISTVSESASCDILYEAKDNDVDAISELKKQKDSYVKTTMSTISSEKSTNCVINDEPSKQTVKNTHEENISVSSQEVCINKTKPLSGTSKTLHFVPKLTNPNNSNNELELDLDLDYSNGIEKNNKLETNKNNKPTKSSQVNVPSRNVSLNKQLNLELGTSTNKTELFKTSTPPCTQNTETSVSKSLPRKSTSAAKENALKWVKKNGPISKNNPTGAKKSGVKRFLNEAVDTDSKKIKLDKSAVISDRFKKIMALTSKHADLLENYDNEQQEKYFSKLEMKEKLEEKMMSTFKVDCKAVRCLTCKYTNFSAAERCKVERHVLKVFNAVKRFFKCGDCGNRTVSLDIVPLFTCKNCNSSKWERTTMMKEKKVHIGEKLSIRGGEQTFINSDITNANINLLVPES